MHSGLETNYRKDLSSRECMEIIQPRQRVTLNVTYMYSSINFICSLSSVKFTGTLRFTGSVRISIINSYTSSLAIHIPPHFITRFQYSICTTYKKYNSINLHKRIINYIAAEYLVHTGLPVIHFIRNH